MKTHLSQIGLILAIILILTGIAWGAIPAQERAALIALYNATNGDHWRNHEGWKCDNNEPDGFSPIGSEGSWHGVWVENETVIGLYFWDNLLSGSIPVQLKNLKHLLLLGMAKNQLSGTIPRELCEFPILQSLALSMNHLSGSIPAEIGNLAQLSTLILSNNSLSGKIPSQIGNLKHLYFLDLSYNELTGDIPPQLAPLTMLGELYLQNNLLSGVIPAGLGNCPSLSWVDISGNNICGPIPADIVNLPSPNPRKNGPRRYDELPPFLFFEYNALYSYDEKVINFMGDCQWDWYKTQTIPPVNLVASRVSSSVVKLTWTPVTYTANSGGYQLYSGLTPNGPWTTVAFVPDKTVSSYEIKNLPPGLVYYFGIRTWTNPHLHNKNRVISNFSQIVSVNSGEQPALGVSPTLMTFQATCTTPPPEMQQINVSNSGTGTLHWSATINSPWLNITPNSGTGNGQFNVSINHAGLSAGTYNGTITVTDPQALYSPQTVSVQLIVNRTQENHAPFGSFDSPVDGNTVSGSIAVTGWALDDGGIEAIRIYREPVGGEPAGLVFIGTGTFVAGTRPDIARDYPYYPMSDKAGWGYMMLTNMLPNKGNGFFVLHAVVTDDMGSETSLGTKTIYGDNLHAVLPFGAIDTPTQGGVVSGKSYINFGWALTPLPNTIPTDGSTINVWVDGKSLGHPVYNQYRQDIAELFPDYTNSGGAGGYFSMDATKLSAGLHTIAWSVKDNAGNTDGIGSRYFSVSTAARESVSRVSNVHIELLSARTPLWVKQGFDMEREAIAVYPDSLGKIHIPLKELERVEIHFKPGTVIFSSLPVGSVMDSSLGIFYWLPGPGFIGEYALVFHEPDETGEIYKREVLIRIHP